MSNIELIKDFVKDDIREFEVKFRSSLRTEVPLLNKITHYIIKRKGKQMRPMFVFLSAKLFSDRINETTHIGASLIELLHTATLVHDDVVDEAKYRRGFFSINALWKNKIAVLVGDYLLSQGLLLAINNKEFKLLEIVSKAVKQMSEGELLQMEKSRLLDTTEEDYYQIIKQKTASLIAACCAVGANSVNTDEKITEQMWQFGEYVGLAFQIKDDLLDFEASSVTGKVRGVDLKEKKLTLPVIYTINNCSPSDKSKIIRLIKSGKIRDREINYIYSKIEEIGGIAYAEEKMNDLMRRAFDILETVEFSEKPDYLKGLVSYTITRKK